MLEVLFRVYTRSFCKLCCVFDGVLVTNRLSILAQVSSDARWAWAYACAETSQVSRVSAWSLHAAEFWRSSSAHDAHILHFGPGSRFVENAICVSKCFGYEFENHVRILRIFGNIAKKLHSIAPLCFCFYDLFWRPLFGVCSLLVD